MQYSRHLVDRRRVHVFGGHGGHGACVFKKHEKQILIGPGYPCGGHGGKGGDVCVKVVSSHHSLAHVDGELRADSGNPGKSKRINGNSGTDVEIRVPRGVTVREMIPPEPKRKSEERKSEDVVGDSSISAALAQEGPRWRIGRVIAELDRESESVIVALGGRGGKGNNMATPYDSKPGLPGQELWIELEMKMIADVGLIGMPNAGKSSLLGSVSRACPKIAPYPFTTVAPYIGRVEFKDSTNMTIADVPGLVENAHLGEGLGHEFLRHLERTKFLLFVLDAAHAHDLLAHFISLRCEVSAYSRAMAEKPCGIVANKCDLDPDFTLPRVDALHRALQDPHVYGENRPIFVRALSARLGQGVPGLLKEVRQVLQDEHPVLLEREREFACLANAD